MNIKDYISGLMKVESETKSEDDKTFPEIDWRYEVDAGDTRRGYADWVDDQIDQRSDEVASELDKILHGAPRCFMGDSTQEDFAEKVVDFFAMVHFTFDEATDRALNILGDEYEAPAYGNAYDFFPAEFIQDISRLCHLGMVAYEGTADQAKIDTLIHEIGEKYDIESDDIEAARARQGIELNASPKP
jgi:hypothetical protein